MDNLAEFTIFIFAEFREGFKYFDIACSCEHMLKTGGSKIDRCLPKCCNDEITVAVQ